jgi:hypothetical protein
MAPSGLLMLCVLGACGSSSGQGHETIDAGGEPAGDAGDPSHDAGSIPRCDPRQPFGRPTLVTDLVGYAGFAWLTDDERTLLYTHLEPGNGLKIYVATRDTSDGAFGAGQKLPDVNGSQQYYDAGMSPDRLRLFYVSSGQTLSISFRTSTTDPWPLGGGLSLLSYRPNSEMGLRPRASARGVYYYVYSDSAAKHTLYFDATGAATSTVIRDASITFTYAMSARERVLYVSDRDGSHPDGTGHFVTKRATRSDPSAAFGEFTPVPELMLTPDLDLRVDWVSEDDCVLYGSVGNSSLTIYRAVRNR